MESSARLRDAAINGTLIANTQRFDRTDFGLPTQNL
jgi:hypothetical protein